MDDSLPQALCFDLDGTLVRYRGDFAAWLGRLLDDLAIAWTVRDGVRGELLRRLPRASGADLTAVVRAALAARGLEAPRDLEAQCREAAVRYLVEVAPIEGAPELLDALGARGLPLALISNGPLDMQRGAAAALGLERFRAVAISGDPAVAAVKPDPAIFAHALAALGTPAAATPVVGDAPSDAIGARRAGMPAWLLGDRAMPTGESEPRRFRDLAAFGAWLLPRLEAGR